MNGRWSRGNNKETEIVLMEEYEIAINDNNINRIQIIQISIDDLE